MEQIAIALIGVATTIGLAVVGVLLRLEGRVSRMEGMVEFISSRVASIEEMTSKARDEILREMRNCIYGRQDKRAGSGK